MVNRLFRWGILIAVLVFAASSFITVKMIFGDNNGSTAPALVGLSAVEATNLLQRAGLSARIDQVDSNYAEGTVVAQSISPGEQTDRGKVVTIKVSRGGTQVKIPDVRNKEFPAATQELESAGLKVGTVIRVSDQLKQPNTVIAQNPAAPALVMNNRMVDLLVSEGGERGAETVQVPDLRGQTEDHARQILEQSYLGVSKVLEVASNQMPEGTVVRTDPRAGARVPTGRAVTLHIAKTPIPVETQQPQPDMAAPPLGVPTPVPAPSPGAGQAPETSIWNPNQPQQAAAPAPQVRAPAATVPTSAVPSPALPGGKIAKVRYQVPPLARQLYLDIVMNDGAGTRALRQGPVQGGEYVSIDAPYSGNATVTVRLGDQQVWQEKYN